MAVIFTFGLRVSDWRRLRRRSDEELILYARAAGAQRYELYRNARDAAEALLLVEAASPEALAPLRHALRSQGVAQLGATPAGLRPDDCGQLWEPAEAHWIRRVSTWRGTSMEANLDLLNRSLEAWNDHDLTTYRRLYAAEALTYGVAPRPLDVDSLIGVYAGFFAGFPDLQLCVEETLADGERVAVRFSLSGTHRGTFQGMPPSGRRIAVQGFSTMRFRGGRVVERWSQLDQLGMLHQLGLLPA